MFGARATEKRTNGPKEKIENKMAGKIIADGFIRQLTCEFGEPANRGRP